MRVLLLALAGLLALPTAGAGSTTMVACGSLAPFVNECATRPFVLPPRADLELATFGFVGRLEATLAWDGGTFTRSCSGPAPPSPALCADGGSFPPAGAVVTLRCLARPVEEAVPLPPAGSWACGVGVGA